MIKEKQSKQNDWIFLLYPFIYVFILKQNTSTKVKTAQSCQSVMNLSQCFSYNFSLIFRILLCVMKCSVWQL